MSEHRWLHSLTNSRKIYFTLTPIIPFNSKRLLTPAAKWIRKAALLRDCYVQTPLGLMSFTGEGVNKNMNLAKNWFPKAATLGHPQAEVK
ncbi:MAG: hypothetical protein DRR19_23740 [Candidatus Parabeggiatoa sp. nov. 1]|nr:MAG: hypothetical protein DRR19_23740 [Gammaproteobacteria bacterium]